VNENQQPISNKIHMFSELSTYTHQIFRHSSMQEASTSWVKAFDDYMCTSERDEMHKLYSERNYKICYTVHVQYIKVQYLYIFTMLCTFYVFTDYSNM